MANDRVTNVSAAWSVGLAIETVVTLAIGCTGAYEGYRLAQQPLLWKDPVGPGWFLFWVSMLILILGLFRMFRPGAVPVTETGRTRGMHAAFTGPAFRLLGVFAVYVAIVPLAGYAIASFLFFTAALKAAGVTTWRNSLLIGLIMTAVFFLFTYELNIYLP